MIWAKIVTPFEIRFKPIAKFQTHCPTSFFIDYTEKVKELLDKLVQQNIIGGLGSTPFDESVY